MSEASDIELKCVKDGYYSGSYRGKPVVVRKTGEKKWWVFGCECMTSGRSKKEAVSKFLARENDRIAELQK
jgi:hypothetical protein